MEFIAIILSGLLSVTSNGGWIVDSLLRQQLNSYIDSAETLAVRVDNNPNYQIARGDIDRLRVAGRGVYLAKHLRIASVELETDSIGLDLTTLSASSLSELQQSLEKPLQGAFSLVITERDIANAFESEEVVAQLQTALNNLVASRAGNSTINYEVINPSIELSPDNKIAIALTLRRSGEYLRESQSKELAIALDLQLEVVRGKQVKLSTLEGTVNGREISNRLLKGFAEGIGDRLDLTTIERQGIFARLLQLEITEDKITIVGFAKMETKSTLVDSNLTETAKP